MAENNLIVFAKVECNKCRGAKLIFTDNWQKFADSLNNAIETQARHYDKKAVKMVMEIALQEFQFCESKPLAPCADCKGKGYQLEEKPLTVEMLAENFSYEELQKLPSAISEQAKIKGDS